MILTPELKVCKSTAEMCRQMIQPQSERKNRCWHGKENPDWSINLLMLNQAKKPLSRTNSELDCG